VNATIGLLAYGLRPSPLAEEAPTWLLAAGAYGSMSWDLQMQAAHAGCHISAFCRNPLHPGPCKGWKHHLGLVSPGALHALEKVRHDKLEERRKAKVDALTKAGHPVPKKLLTPIVYDPAKNKHIGPNSGPAVTPGSPNLTPAAAKKAVAAVPTANDLRNKVNTRRAALPTPNAPAAAAPGTPAVPNAPAAPGALPQHTPEQLAAAYSIGLLMHVGVPQQQAEAERGALERQFAQAIANPDPKDLQGMANQFTSKLIAKAEKDSGKKLYSGHSTVSQAMNEELVRKFKGDHAAPTPVTDAILKGDTDTAHTEALNVKKGALQAKKSISAAKGAATRAANKQAAAVPAAPLPSGTPAHVQNAVAIAHRSGPRAGVAKVQLDAYNNLTKAEFDALPDATKKRIADDLKAAHGKFLDPSKKRSVEHTMGRLGVGPHPAPSATPGGVTPSTPAPARSPIGVPHGPGAPAAPSAPAPKVTPPSSGGFTPADIGTMKHLGKKHSDRLADFESLTHGQLTGLSDQQRAALHGDLMNISARSPSADHRKRAQQMVDRLNAAQPTTPASQGAAVKAANAQGFADKLDAIRAETDPRKIASALTAARYAATEPDHKKALDELAGEVAGNGSHPAWLRAHAYMINDDNRTALPKSADLSMAIHTASKAPSSNGRIFATTHDLENLLAPDRKELDRLPPVLRDAIQARRTEALKDTFDPVHGATLQARESALVTVFGDPQGKHDMTRYEALTPEGRKVVDEGLTQHVVNKWNGSTGNDASRASAWQSVDDNLKGRSYSGVQQDAIKAAQATHLPADQRLSDFKKLTASDYQALPDAHKSAISMPILTWAGSSPDPTVKRDSMHTLAKLSGLYPDYALDRHQNAVLAATVDRPFLSPKDRLDRYYRLTAADYGFLKKDDQGVIARDMQSLADDRSGGLSLEERHDMQYHHDTITPGGVGRYTPEQRKAITFSDPGVSKDVGDRLSAYGQLNKGTFDALPVAYQDAIMHDMSIISVSHPSAHDAIMVKFNPSYVPSNNIKPTNVSGNVDPALKDAVETLYGVHPQSGTAAHQLKVYGALKKQHFDQLNSDEQSTLLGDLSYIATTSKSQSSKDRAERLINNFTPPGTPYGQPNVQAAIPPSNAVAGQVRDPNPAGKTGLLVQSKDKGLSGDGWTTTPSGKRVWGKYGASGVLLRHVGPDGKERFLMVQRGPAISDPGKWQFPGGAIDSKETAYTGGTREVIEELGFKDGALDNAAVHGHHEAGLPGSTWKYTSIAATVPHQLVPDLSDPHARAETSDAKWMTREEIAKLDTNGKLLAPLAGGKLEQNVLSLFPPHAQTVGRPAPRTSRPGRLSGTPSIANVVPSKPHKQTRAKNLIKDTQAEKDLSGQIKTLRKQYAGKTADDRLAAIGSLQGFDETPTVLPKHEVDRLLASGDYVEAWRGVYGGGGKSAAQINEEMRSGPAYYGTGIFGNGYYLATSKSVAQQYADGSKNSVVRILIPKDAVTVDHGAALDGAKKSYSSVPYRYQARHTTGQGSLHDEGRWAAAAGKDGIVIDQYSRSPGGGASHVASRGKPAYNWLNRSVLILQEADK